MYSPKIREDFVRRLYLLKHSGKDKIPITKLANKAIEEFLERMENKDEGVTETGRFDSIINAA